LEGEEGAGNEGRERGEMKEQEECSGK